MEKQIVPAGYRNIMGLCMLALLLAALSACTTTPAISNQFRQQANLTVDYLDIRLEPENYTGEKVILGGYLLEVFNKPQQSNLLVLQAPLEYSNEPMSRDLSKGRFLIRTSRFLDPEVYSPGRKITVGGVVTGTEKQQIGDIDYTLPVIESRELTLWPEDDEYYRPYWPYYPYYHDPYYYHRFPHRSPFAAPR